MHIPTFIWGGVYDDGKCRKDDNCPKGQDNVSVNKGKPCPSILRVIVSVQTKLI